MAEFDQVTLAIDNVADLGDFDEQIDFNQEIFVDENGVAYVFLYFIEFYGQLTFDSDLEEFEELFMSDEELDAFMEEDEDFRHCHFYNDMCEREQ